MSDAEPPIREGWQLGKESWHFHREFCARVGRTTEFHEYSTILWAIRKGDVERVAPFAFRYALPEGLDIIVRGGRLRLSGVEPADWTPPQPKPLPKSKAPKHKAVTTPVPAPPQPIPEPERRPLKASTLTLGSPAAAKALAERLRKMGVSAHIATPTSNRALR